MLQKFILLLIPPLVFLGLLALLVMVWYVALPLLVLLFVISWFRARQIRKAWEQFYGSAMAQPVRAKRVKKTDDIIDADYEEIKE